MGAPLSPEDLIVLHDACICDPNCDLCAAETVEDEAPGGQCDEGICWHDDCREARTTQVERGVV